MDGERFPALFGLVCEQCSGRNVFYRIDVVRQYVIARCCPRRVVVRKQIFADLAADLMNDLPALFLVSIFSGSPSLCGSSWNKLRTSEHRIHCSFLPETARVGGCTIAESCEAPGTSCVGSRTIKKSSMESLHGFNPIGSSRSRSSNMSSSVGAVKSGEAVDNNIADESPYVC